MADMESEYRLILNKELQARKERNPRFSLRAFARFLKCDPTYLSKVNSGEFILSVDMAAQFADMLRLCKETRREFILSAAEEQKCHALYLIDPTLTACSPESHATNVKPVRRVRK